MLLAHDGNNMGEHLQEPVGFQAGDKIRVRSGPYAGARGIIQAEKEGVLAIQLDGGNTILIDPQEITNYSLAARRAWQTMPKRSGRPQLLTPRKRMMSMRLDIDVWNMLQEAAERGLISNRERTVNDWIREQVIVLLAKDE